MNEKSLDVLKQYDIDVYKTMRGRGGMLLFTNQGVKLFLECNHPDKYYERYESGSPNIVAIYGLIESCKWLKENDVFIKEKELTKYLIEQLRKNLKIEIYAPDNTDSCLHSGIVCFYRSPRWHWSHYLKNSGHA